MTSRRKVLAGAAGAGLAMNLSWLGQLLAADRITSGVRTVSGEVTVNGNAASLGTQVRAGDSVVTGPNGDVVFVVGRDAFMIRPESRVELLRRGNSPLLTGLRYGFAHGLGSALLLSASMGVGARFGALPSLPLRKELIGQKGI